MMTTSRREAILRQNAVDTLDNLARAAEDRSQGGLRGRFKGLVEDIAKENMFSFARLVAARTLALGQKIRSTNARVDALDSTKVDATAAATAVEAGEKALTRLGKGLLKVAKNVALLTRDVAELQRENRKLKDELAEVRKQLAHVTALTQLAFGNSGEFASNAGCEQMNSHSIDLLCAIDEAHASFATGGKFEEHLALPNSNPTALFTALTNIRENLRGVILAREQNNPTYDYDAEVARLESIISNHRGAVNEKITGMLFEFVIEAMLESDSKVTAQKLVTINPVHLAYVKSVITNPDNIAYVCSKISALGAPDSELESTYDALVQSVNGGN